MLRPTLEGDVTGLPKRRRRDGDAHGEGHHNDSFDRRDRACGSGCSCSVSPPALIVLGITQLRNAPVDVLPEFTPPYVEVQTEALGLSAEEVEQLITVPLEADLLNGVAGRRHDPLGVGARPVVDR